MIRKLFKRHLTKQRRESAPQLAAHERRAHLQPGIPPAGLPYATYDEMQRDSMVQTVLTLKKLGVLAGKWSIVPASGTPTAKAKADFALESLQQMEGSPLTLLFHAMDSFAKGWSIQEKVWRLEGGKLILQAVRPKDPELFGVDLDEFGTLRGLRLQVPGEAPRDLDPSKFVIFLNRGAYGRPKGRSDLDAAFRHWQAKSALLTAWRIHLERFAMPTVLGRFERGIPGDEQTALLDKLQNLHLSTAITYPSEISIDTLGGFKEPSTGFMEAIEFHNREIARSVLGQTLTTDEGRRVGSLALGRVHLQVLLLQLEAIRRELADSVMTEQVLRPLVELNFGPGETPRFEFESPELGAFVLGQV